MLETWIDLYLIENELKVPFHITFHAKDKMLIIHERAPHLPTREIGKGANNTTWFICLVPKPIIRVTLLYLGDVIYHIKLQTTLPPCHSTNILMTFDFSKSFDFSAFSPILAFKCYSDTLLVE